VFQESFRLSGLEEYSELSADSTKRNPKSFWYDNWVGTQNLVDLIGIKDGVLPDPSIKVSEFIHNAQWNMQKLQEKIVAHITIKDYKYISSPKTASGATKKLSSPKVVRMGYDFFIRSP